MPGKEKLSCIPNLCPCLLGIFKASRRNIKTYANGGRVVGWGGTWQSFQL